MYPRETAVMDCVVTGKPINLPVMMIGYMAEACCKKRSTLPYGMILTMAFQNQGVNILDNEPMKNLRHTDYYNSATLHRMGFLKVNGHWERKGQFDDRAAEVETAAPGPSEAGPSVRHSSPGPSSSAPPAAPAPAPTTFAQGSSGFSERQLEQLKALFAEHEVKIKNEIENQLLGIRQLCYSLEDKVSGIESSLSTSSDALKTDLKLIFDKLKDIGGDSDTYSKCNAELQEKVTIAAALVEKMLNDFMKIQEKGMGQILEELKRILR